MPRSRAAALLLAAWVGACAAPAPPPSRTAETPAAAPTHVAPRPAVAAPPAPVRAAPPTEPRTASLPPAPPPDPNELMGLDAAALAARLGTPGFERREDPARLWRYDSAACFMDLYLYRVGESDTYRVTHMAVRGRDGATVAPAECYRSLLEGMQPGLG